MATYGTQISHVREYYCQYTDQIHKKHKSWHDGRMKYYQLNHKFQLFSLEGGMLLGSTIITSSRRVEHILNANGFNKEEHKIFGQFLVLIDCLQCEYDRDISGKARELSVSYNIKKYTEDAIDSEPCQAKSGKFTTPVIRHNDSLALKFNKPFRRPLAKRTQINVRSKLKAPSSSKSLDLNSEVENKKIAKSMIKNEPISLAIDMSTSKKHPKAPKSYNKEVATIENPDHVLTSKLTTGFSNHNAQGPLQEPIIEQSLIPATKTIKPAITEAHFRVNRKSLVLKHDPIVLDNRSRRTHADIK
ncbi:LAFA_0A02058g1_1 [Lachancea sp. 'fantastica']|nr:LAFA_0A02058g1_1 [Lachancea sp. 'fantastica']